MKIKLWDYERIYKTINAIILNEKALPTAACTFFSFYGALILREHYKIDAQPVAGLCMYRIGGDNNVITFGKKVEDKIVASTEAFHCWVEGEGWLFDFMAPNFSDFALNNSYPIESKMMQKPLVSMVESSQDLIAEGDFYLESNYEVLKDRMNYLSSSSAYGDLGRICKQWYVKPPKNMLKTIQIGNSKGKVSSVSLTGNSVVGAW